MGALFSRFRWKRTPSSGAEVNEEQKEESTSEKDGVPVPSSPSQDTVVTTASSGGDKVQESPTKAEAPLAKEEEFTQQASPVEEDLKEPKQEEEEAKTGDVEAPEPEVKELQRVNETKLEKEKTVDTSGVTTEKTVYTQMSESVTIQETKGPAVDPFASSQSSPSYVHSVKVTESGPSSPSSPVSVKSDAPAPEKTQAVHELSESESEKIPSEPEKGEVSIKSEVVEVATDVAESLSDSHPETEKLEVQSSSLAKEQKEHVDQETSGNEAEVIYEEEVVDDSERTDVEGAVVKIQAGIRGYLTRKALKESRKDGPLMQSEIGGASVQTTSKQEEIPAEEPPVSNSREQAVTDNSAKEHEEEDAAVKIQAVYRGYRTRKQLDEMSNEPCDEEVETLNTSAKKKTESPVQERRSPPDRSPVTVTENFVPILKAQITITPPSSPTLKHQHSLPSEAEPKDSKSSAIPETSGNTDETSHPGLSDDGEDGLNKKQAATKIQAAFRGYQVRKVSRKEAPGSVKGISETKESTDMDIAVGSNVPEDVDHESSPPLLRDSPSPPLDPDNEEDTLEDSTADDVEEIPNVEWQTSELYADDSTSKHLHEPDGSKTETMTEVTAPVEDSPKTVPMSSEQVILSTAKITLESHGSPLPTTEEDQQMQSDQ